MTAEGSIPTLLSIDGLTKHFGATCALNHVSLSVRAGEIHGLIGANGSGKSTLIKILAGYHRQDSGTVVINGEELPVGFSPARAKFLGMHFLHQDTPLIERLSVAENLAILGTGYARRRGGRVDWRRLRRETEHALRDFALQPSPDQLVSTLSPAGRATVAVAAMLADKSAGSRLLVFDEATAALPADEARKVVDVARAAAARGSGGLFVSHRLEEILAVASRITVLRDGQQVATVDAKDVDETDLIQLMLGSHTATLTRSRGPAVAKDGRTVRLAVRHLTANRLRDVGFDVHEGEIVGVMGLIGCGRSELGRVIVGVQDAEGGEVSVDSIPVPMGDLAGVQRKGVVYVPADRLRHSAIPRSSIADNVLLRSQRSWFAWDTVAHQSSRVQPRIAALGVNPANPTLPMTSLSGGNQQKVVLAKWIDPLPAVLILDEPTRGVDVGAKEEIYAILRSLARQGTAVLVLATEQEEVMVVCDRALILSDGRLTAELSGAEMSEENILAHTYKSIPRRM